MPAEMPDLFVRCFLFSLNFVSFNFVIFAKFDQLDLTEIMLGFLNRKDRFPTLFVMFWQAG